MAVPSTPEQLQMDFRMLGIMNLGPNMYQVGPWRLSGPAMESVRQNLFLRTALLLANPKVPPSVKRLFAKEVEE